MTSALEARKVLIDADNTTPEYTLRGMTAYARVTAVYDGDSMTCVFDIGFGTLYRYDIRVCGIDTPEMKDKDQMVKAYATRARNRMLSLLCPSEFSVTGTYNKREIVNKLKKNLIIVHLTMHGIDKYGRQICEVRPEAGEEQYGDILIREGYAKPYGGVYGLTKDVWQESDVYSDKSSS